MLSMYVSLSFGFKLTTSSSDDTCRVVYNGDIVILATLLPDASEVTIPAGTLDPGR